MRKSIVSLISIVFLVVCGCSSGSESEEDQSLIWQTSKEEAVSEAKAEGKKILLLAGRETCSFTMDARDVMCESASPPIKNLIQENFVPWFCDVDSSTDWEIYAGGLGTFTLPLICCIDPETSDSYLDRSTGPQEPEVFYSRLQSWGSITIAKLRTEDTKTK